jgi:hypothetical protein
MLARRDAAADQSPRLNLAKELFALFWAIWSSVTFLVSELSTARGGSDALSIPRYTYSALRRLKPDAR